MNILMPHNVKIKFIFIVSIFILLSIACSQKVDPQKVDRYIQDLKSKSLLVRKDAVWALRNVKDPKVVPALIEVLEDEDLDVRVRAVNALGYIGQSKATAPLIPLLKDEHYKMRRSAAQALGEIKDPKAVPALIEVLEDEDLDVRVRARRALMDIGPEAVEKAVNVCVEDLTDWHSNQEVAKILFYFSWKPQSEQDKIHFLVAQRKGKHLRKLWNLTKKVLLRDVESNKYRTIENALLSFMGIGKKEIIPVLIKKLEQKGNKIMAEAYLNCGQKELNEAAKNWAARHGYEVSSGSGAHPVKWGGM